MRAAALRRACCVAVLSCSGGVVGLAPASAAGLTVAADATSVFPAAARFTLPLLVVAAVFLVVALVGAALLLRRRASSPRSRRGSAEVRTDRSSVWTVDRALRALVAESARTGTPVPQPYLVTVDAETITMGLTSPRAAAPPPWTVTDQGRRWSAALRDLQTVTIDDGVSAPCPCLVSLGDAGGALVLLDLSQARGAISVNGDPEVVGLLLRDWEVQLRGNPWARPGLPLVRVGTPDAARPGAVVVGSLAAAVDEVSEQRDGVLIVATPLNRRERDALGALVRAPDASWTVVVGGELQHARWRFSISDDGSLDTEILDAAVGTHLIDR